ncbi:uncharacterized protein LOC117176477 [Belonocnema kinseyi]|uniref:uncharacterized protein LOC117176477 n=1 Tax=Belonocnema kinseyi TaxID=2817044 RepID=UPI00143D99AB|nr:uncharacterized protein LOC117176477 [Belonocnema kinseyi]
MSASVGVEKANGDIIRGRALLDTCATVHFITEEFSQRLNLPVRPCNITISAINGIDTRSNGSVEVLFYLIHSQFSKKLSFLTVPKIADTVPNEHFPRSSIRIPAKLKLADPQFHIPRSVDMLIGSGATLSLFSIGQINLSRNGCDLYLQKTQLGWVVVGGVSSHNGKKIAICKLTELSKQIEKFCLLEENSAKHSGLSEDSECEGHYVQNTTRDTTGKYIVRLPFRTRVKMLSKSQVIALRRFYALQGKLNANEALKKEYSRVMRGWISSDHMTPLETEWENGYYMPHHAVFKDTSAITQLRVVFDASAKLNTGVSLNDILMTVTFGVSVAPFLAIRTVQQLADDEGDDLKIGAKTLKHDFYVDDLSTGANSVGELLQIRNKTTDILNRGGMTIRQW